MIVSSFCIVFMMIWVAGNNVCLSVDSFDIKALLCDSDDGISRQMNSRLEWYITTVDENSQCVGYGNAIAIDSTQSPHISYVDGENNKIKHASLANGQWQIEVVDSFTQWTNQTSIATDHSNCPHMSYSGDWQVKYAKRNGSFWQSEVVDYTTGPWHSCGNSLVLNNIDYPRIVYGNSDYHLLKYAKWDGLQWQRETVDSAGQFAVFNEFLCLDNSQNPHMSYNKDFNDVYAFWTGSSWYREVADSSNTTTCVSLALDADNNPHIAFYKDMYLIYAKRTDTLWTAEVVDYLTSIYTPAVSIALDHKNNPYVAYWGNHRLRFARRSTPGWLVEIVDPENIPDGGIEPSIIVDRNRYIHISYSNGVLWSQGKLKYATTKPPGAAYESSSTDLNEDLVLAFPNPFSHSTTVRYFSHGRDQLATMRIFDIAGKCIEITTNSRIGTNLKPGVYFLLVNDSKPIKLIKL